MKRKLTIVIVDEHGADLPVFKRLTREFPGSHVMCFPQLEPAERECAVHPPDIFVIDDAVPEAIARTFDRHFREHPGLGDALIVLMSARGGPLPDQSRRAGVDVFLPKPVDTKFFLQMLHQAVELRAARAAIAAQRIVP
jgi:CheY-like chemotaxis protein